MSKSKNTSFLEKAQDFIATNNEKTIAKHDANAKKFQTDGMPVQKAFKTIRESINIKNLKRAAMGAFAISAMSNAFNIAPSQANSSENKNQLTLEQVIVSEASKDGSQVKSGGVRAGLEAVTKGDGKFTSNEIATFVETRNRTNGFIDSKKDQADTNAIINKVNAGENIIQAASEVAFSSPEAKIQDGKNQAAGKVTEGQYYAQIIANSQKSILEKQNQKPAETKPTTKTFPQTPTNTNIAKPVRDDLGFNTNISTPKDKNSLEIMASDAENVISTIDKAITPGVNATEVKDVQKIMSNDKFPTLSSKYDEMITPQIEKHTSENKALQVQLKKDLKTLNNSNARYQSAKKIVDKSPSEGNKANLKVLENNAKNQYAQVAKTLTQLENISSSAEAKSNLGDTLRTLYGAFGGAVGMATIWGIYSRVNKNKNKPDLQQQQPGTIIPPGKFGQENTEVERNFIANPNQYDKPIGPETQEVQKPETLKLKSLEEMTNNELANEIVKMGTASEYDKKRFIANPNQYDKPIGPETQEVQKPETLKLKSLEEMTNNELANEIVKMGTASEYDKKRIDLDLVKFFNNEKKINGSTAIELPKREFFHQVPFYISSLQIKGNFNQDVVYEIFEIARDNLISLVEPSKPVTINLDTLRSIKPLKFIVVAEEKSVKESEEPKIVLEAAPTKPSIPEQVKKLVEQFKAATDPDAAFLQAIQNGEVPESLQNQILISMHS